MVYSKFNIFEKRFKKIADQLIFFRNLQDKIMLLIYSPACSETFRVFRKHLPYLLGSCQWRVRLVFMLSQNLVDVDERWISKAFNFFNAQIRLKIWQCLHLVKITLDWLKQKLK